MKKFTLLLGIGALSMASCSNDEVIDSKAGATDETPIGFAVSTRNMSRVATEMADDHLAFGVYAYKGTTAPADMVMDDYLVGYWNGTYGYNPLGSQTLLGTGYPTRGYVWYYQGLGNLQADAWTDADGDHTASYSYVKKDDETGATSSQEKQYLKYWDRNSTYTWFYAYAPYNLNVQYDAANHKLIFPEMTSLSGENAMYATKRMTNPTSTGNPYVDLTFHRLLAKVRLAFYEEVPGYKVELIEYKAGYNIPNTDPWKSFGDKAMFAVPATKSGDVYSAGTYVTTVTPVLTFSASDYETPAVEYTSPSKTGETLNIPLWFHPMNDPTAVPTYLLGTSTTDALVNDTKDVLPAGTGEYANCGFTVNLSLKFTALDTDEVIYVRGVRAHIPAADCQWAPNHMYTYYFKVTKNVPGTPGTPDDPSVDPGKDPYLLPIVFDHVTVEEIVATASEEHTYNVND